MFSHGWPLSADDWDPQMFFSSAKAIASLRVIGAGATERVANNFSIINYSATALANTSIAEMFGNT
jgi:non-heme chloroperoxidase